MLTAATLMVTKPMLTSAAAETKITLQGPTCCTCTAGVAAWTSAGVAAGAGVCPTSAVLRLLHRAGSLSLLHSGPLCDKRAVYSAASTSEQVQASGAPERKQLRRAAKHVLLAPACKQGRTGDQDKQGQDIPAARWVRRGMPVVDQHQGSRARHLTLMGVLLSLELSRRPSSSATSEGVSTLLRTPCPCTGSRSYVAGSPLSRQASL